LAPAGTANTLTSVGRADLDTTGRISDLAFAPDGASLYVGITRSTGSALAWINRTTGASLERLQLLQDSLTTLQLLPDGRSLAVTTVSGGGSVAESVLQIIPTDLATSGVRVPLCQGVALGLAPDGVRDRMYAVCRGDELAEIDRKLGVRVRGVQLSPDANRQPCDVADVHTSANGSVVFVLCAGSGTLLYLDRVQLTPYDSLPVGTGGQRLARTPDGRYVAITRPSDDELVVVDVRRRIVTHRLPIEGVSDVIIGIDGRSAFVTATAAAQSRLHRVTLATGESVSQEITVSRAHRVAVWPGPKSPKMRWRHQP
jgi:DNA-binding beta-propeller fold protein YncE